MNTIEEKARAYDEAIENAKKLMVTSTAYDKFTIEKIFPELRESDDKRIRKAILELVRQSSAILDKQNQNNMIAWLEKQSSNVDNANKEYWRGYREGKQEILDKYAELEKQVDQKPANKIEPKFKVGDEITTDNCESLSLTITKIDEQGYWSEDLFICSFEDSAKWKLEERKPTDNVKSKFNIGDWITFYGGNPFKILKIEEEQNGILDYLLLDQNGHDSYYNKKYVDKNARLWTIRDAKDGDILACKSGWTCIFKTLVDNETFSSYCFMDNTKWFCETGSESHTLNTKFMDAYHGEIKPATKEQRDLLFAKMKEAGYVWDSDNKEMKLLITNGGDFFETENCDQEQTIDYPDNLPKDNWELVHEFVEKFGRIPEDEDELNALVEYVLNRQESTWSEKDEDFFNDTITFLKDTKNALDHVNWLKSLKCRVQPQQKHKWSEDEVIDAEIREVEDNDCSMYAYTHLEIYTDADLSEICKAGDKAKVIIMKQK